MSTRQLDGRHAIAARNREAIIESAYAVISSDPNAGIGVIADNAGVARATLYRHFPTRAALIDALRRHALQRGRERLALERPEQGTPVEALERIFGALIELGPRDPVLFPSDDRPTLAERELIFEPLLHALARAAGEGLIADDLSDPWLIGCVRGLVRAARAEIHHERLRAQDAPALIVRQLLTGTAPRKGGAA